MKVSTLGMWAKVKKDHGWAVALVALAACFYYGVKDPGLWKVR